MKGLRSEWRGVAIGRVLSVLEVSGGVGGGGRRPGAGRPVHRENVEQGRGAEVVHIDHARVPHTVVLVLAEYVAALVLALENVGVQRPMGLIVDGLLVKLQVEVLVLVVILGDPPPGVGGGSAVDQRTEAEPDVWSGLILALAQDCWKCEYLFLEKGNLGL